MPLHHLMVGTWTPPGAIFTFAFDDEALTLDLVKRTAIPEEEPISWMTFNHDKTAIYGAAMKKWSSYSVESPVNITHQVSHPMPHAANASNPDTNTRAIFLLAAKMSPHGVYCNPFYTNAGHGSVYTPDPSTGALAANVQNYPYQPDTGIHGMVLNPADERYLYSADLSANKIWVHRRPSASSPSVELVGSVDAPDPSDHPRWVAIHPSGSHLYVLMEKGNRVCEYTVDAETRMPAYTGRHFPLAPPGTVAADGGHFRGDVAALSFSGKYLFASTRGSTFAVKGYVTALRISDEDGSIEKQVLLEATPTSGGHSNAVSPADWTDEWLAITDDEEGYLEIYRWKDEKLELAAKTQVQEPGFGMNAIWYD